MNSSADDAAPDVVYIPAEHQPDRNLVVLLLDASRSMHDPEEDGGPRKIDALIDALRDFLSVGMHQDELLEGGVNRLQVNGEIAIAAFGHEHVTWLHLADEPVEFESPFYYVQKVKGLSAEAEQALQPNGNTPMALAINDALDTIERRKDSLMADGLTHECRPNLFLLTDGQPSNPIDAVANRIATEEADNRILFWAFGTRGCHRETLLRLAGRENGCIFLGKKPMAKYLQFLNRSMRHQPSGDTEQSADELKNHIIERIDDEDEYPE